VIEDSKSSGKHYIVNPWIGDDLLARADGWQRAAETFNRGGEISHKTAYSLPITIIRRIYPTASGELPYTFL